MRSMAQGIVIFFRAHCRAPGGRPRHALRVVPRAERGGAPSYRTATAYVRQERKSILGLFSAQQLSPSHGEQWFVRQARRNERPAVAEATYLAHALTDSATINPILPVIWFIDPASGDVQFRDTRQAGLCAKVGLQ